MAGIGFRLQALVSKGSYLEAATAYLSATIIVASPWLVSAVALLALSNTTPLYLPQVDRSLLSATVISVYVASLLVAGGPQLLVTRYVADRLYVKDTASVAPTCVGVLCMLIPFAIIAFPFLLFAPFVMLYRLLVTTLFLTLTMIWIVMVFLSAARGYLPIIVIFVISYALGIGTSILLGYRYGLLGGLAGFTLGQMMCLTLLIMNIYLEFPSTQGISLAYLSYISKYWDLVVIGALYTLGIWVDSVIFWLSSQGQVIHGFFHLFPAYDTAKFIGYLSTIPAAAIFMIHVETNFHRHYQNYYQSIQTKGTLTDLVRAKEGMREAFRSGVRMLLKVQGFIALFLCLIAQALAAFVGLAPNWVPLLRLEVLAGGGQFFMLIMMVLLLYVDRRRIALLAVGVFMLCNTILTLLSLYLGNAFYGMGNLGACIAGAIIGGVLFNNQLKELEYLTFMEQPWG